MVYEKTPTYEGLEYADTQPNVPLKRWTAKAGRGGPADTDAAVRSARSHEVPRNTGHSVRKADGEFSAGTGLVAVGAAVIPTHLEFGKVEGLRGRANQVITVVAAKAARLGAAHIFLTSSPHMAHLVRICRKPKICADGRSVPNVSEATLLKKTNAPN